MLMVHPSVPIGNSPLLKSLQNLRNAYGTSISSYWKKISSHLTNKFLAMYMSLFLRKTFVIVNLQTYYLFLTME